MKGPCVLLTPLSGPLESECNHGAESIFIIGNALAAILIDFTVLFRHF